MFKTRPNAVPEMRARKKLVTGSNGIMVAETFFFNEKKKRHQISIYKQFSG
jgi:hypothetical protein